MRAKYHTLCPVLQYSSAEFKGIPRSLFHIDKVSLSHIIGLISHPKTAIIVKVQAAYVNPDRSMDFVSDKLANGGVNASV